jgi:hypothetical protein
MSKELVPIDDDSPEVQYDFLIAEDKKLGRPTKYCPNIADNILKRIAKGETLYKIAKDLPVSRTAVYYWLQTNPTFSDRYTRARALQATAWADEIYDISEGVNPDGTPRDTREFGHVTVQRDKLRIGTRQWLMAKARPDLYGDKVEVEHKGEVKVTPVINIGIAVRGSSEESRSLPQDTTNVVPSVVSTPTTDQPSQLEQSTKSLPAKEETVLITEKTSAGNKEG